MHDPQVVAFEIRRPWPTRRLRATGRRYWPALITVWHREPGGADAGTVCRHYRTDYPPPAEPYDETAYQAWTRSAVHITGGWRWHVWHWRVQVHPAQALRRRLLTRCAGCGGRSRPGSVVNVSGSWDAPGGRWWRGEPNLWHAGCYHRDATRGQP